MIETYPDHNIPNKQKGAKWILQYAKAMWSEWRGSVFYDQRDTMIECQEYSKGQQSVSKYKKAMDTEENQGFLNLDWTPISVLPKFVDITVGKIIRTGLALEAKSIDQLGVDAKQFFHHMQIGMQEVQSRLQDSQFFQSMYGAQMDTEDIEVFMEMDYKDTYEVAAEDTIELTDRMCYPEETFRGFLKNIVVEGKGALRVYEDSNGIVKYRKVNPIEMIHSSVSMPDFRDAYHFGEVVYYTISDIRAMDKEGAISQADWKKLIEQNNKLYGNPDMRNRAGRLLDLDEVQYDSFRIPCLDFEFKSHKNITHSKKKGKFQEVVKKRNDDYEPPKGVEMMKKSVSTWYKGFWVIGTDFLLDHGEVTNLTRGDKATGSYSDSYSNFIAYAPSIEDGDSEISSIVRRAIPFVDGAQLAWLNFQNVVARAVPKGGYVDAKSMSKAAELLKLKEPLEIFKLFKAKGWMVGYGSDELGNNNRPIIEMENGLGKDFGNYLQAMEFNINQVREVTGISAIVDASAPTPGALVGTAKLAEAATNNSLVPILMAKKSVRERQGMCTVKKVQSVLLARATSNMPIPAPYHSLGRLGLETLMTAKEFAMSEFAFTVRNEPSEEETAAFYQELERAVQNQEITTAQSLKAKQLAAESVDRAIAYLRKEIKKNQAQAAEKAQQDMILNQQIQQQSLEAKAKEEMMRLQTEKQNQIEILQTEYALKMELASREHEYNMQLKELEVRGSQKKEETKQVFGMVSQAMVTNQNTGRDK